MSARKNYIEKVIARVEEMARDFEKDMQESLKDLDFGTRRPKVEEVAAFVAMQYAKYPPEPWIAPDGTPVLDSSWWLAVQENDPEMAKNLAPGRELYLEARQRMAQQQSLAETQAVGVV